MVDIWNLARLEALAPTPKAWAEAKQLADGGAFRDIIPSFQFHHAWQATVHESDGTHVTCVSSHYTNTLVFYCTCCDYPRTCNHSLGLAYHLAARPGSRPVIEVQSVAPELDALVRACFANPKQNLPRLVLADYLEERDETDRATILRIQCELPPPKKKGEKPKIARGMSRLLKAAIDRVTSRLGTRLRKTDGAEFRRGFLTFNLGWAWFHDVDREIDPRIGLMREGGVERLSLLGFRCDRLSKEVWAALRGVRVIDLSQCLLSDEDLAELAMELRPGHPDSRLREVIVPKRNSVAFARLTGTATAETPRGERQQAYRSLTPDRFRHLLASGVLNGVVDLTLGGDLGPTGVSDFVQSQSARNLRVLRLSRINPLPDVMRQLCQISARELEQLHFEYSGLGDTGVAELCGGELFPSEQLTLHYENLSSAGAMSLANCQRLSNLRSLNLTGNAVGRDGIEALLTSTHLNSLTDLIADRAKVDGGILSALFHATPRPLISLVADGPEFQLHRRRNGPPELTIRMRRTNLQLRLPYAAHCPEPLAKLTILGARLSRMDWRRLHAWLSGQSDVLLEFAECRLGNEAVSEILKLVELVTPSGLDLRDNAIGVNGCKALAACPALATVSVLDLTGNPIRLSGAMAIAESEHRGKLKTFRAVGLGRTLSAAERKKLTAAFTGVKVQF